ncbi:alanine racemase [Aggregatimonas sangjinii]|uniref:Alanine racemase n=1 Tax=Aggregatimonas sangjinii TaxID=2583587 RepID=A0A5B7STT4_9FLAO|nr:alanine racemase [Aggregatimonas sangjinii]QCX02016.1 alanine racemase [Aggregatimonas sangjinii]
MGKATETTLEIDFGALEHNYHFLRGKLKPDTKFLAVMKAFAYGSDAERIALKMQALGVDYFAVAYSKEGIALRKAGIQKPILVLHPLPLHFEELISHCLEPSIYSRKVLLQFLKTAKKLAQTNYPVHLKFNTGLNRLGFAEKDIDFITEELKQQDEIKVISNFSHLAASEDANEKDFTLRQIKRFDRIAETIALQLGYRPFRHLLNTSGILNYAEAQYDMVRSGIGLYGYGNHPEIDKRLKPVAILKTVISQIHEIAPGDTVGYNRAFITKDYRMTATLPLGHADGIGRQYGQGNTFVTVNGEMAFIVGNVCMDMIMIDVTGIACKEGDEVIVFGHHPSAETFAATANTISYELLTGISQRVNRTFIGY